MEAEEVRMNNWVYNDYLKKNVVVCGIEENSLWALENFEDEDSRFRGPLGAFHGIPLTEEWLLKTGFKRTIDSDDDVVFRLNGIELYYYEFIFKEENGFYFQYVGDLHVKYVHQVQNLIYALTNTELTINL